MIKKFLLILTIFTLSACALLSRYDHQSYLNFTGLKADILLDYEKKELNSITHREMHRIIEYETYKPVNTNTVVILNNLHEMYHAHLDTLPWSDFIYQEYTNNMQSILETLIRSERNKNHVPEN